MERNTVPLDDISHHVRPLAQHGIMERNTALDDIAGALVGPGGLASSLDAAFLVLLNLTVQNLPVQNVFSSLDAAFLEQNLPVQYKTFSSSLDAGFLVLLNLASSVTMTAHT